MPRKIAILAPSAVPFEVGGAEKLWWGMRQALTLHGDAFVDLLKLPCREKSFLELLDSYEAFSRLDLSHFDMLITTKYPAWIAPHHNHICYLQHTLRGLYDTYAQTGLPETLTRAPARLDGLLALARKLRPNRDDFAAVLELARSAATDRALPASLFAFPGPLIREITHFFDRVALAPGQIKAYLAISRNVATRKDYFPPDVPVKVLPHPSDLVGLRNGPGSYFFTASRLHANKRVKLVCQAMRHVPLDIPLKIAGTGPELALLQEQFAHDRRIEFLGYVPDARLADLYAGAICVPYLPLDEDYGLITIEAMQSGKPVVTTPDAGGVCEFVEDGKTGYIVEPYAPALGLAMTRLGRDPALAAALGANAMERVKGITWPETIRSLLDYAAAPNGAGRKKAVVLAPFRAQREGAGGPRRLYHFMRQLARSCAARLICYGPLSQQGTQVSWEEENIREISLPWPGEFLREAREIAEATGQSSDDLAIMRHCARDMALLECLRREADGADYVILSHPWLFGAAQAAIPDAPLFYDAHNVEADLKEAIFGKGGIASEVATLEGAACRKAARVFVCSDQDASRVASLYGVEPERLTVLANGCEISLDGPGRKACRKRLPFADEPMVLFVGSDHGPNVDAALEIFSLAGEIPNAQFLLVGSVCLPPRVARRPRPANLHLLGPLSENVKRVLLLRADLALNPVVSGSGVNLKIMEYLGYGTPCLSTPFGARGLPQDLAPALTIAELADFGAAIRSLLLEPPARDKVDAVGRRVAAMFDWHNTLGALGPSLKKHARRGESGAPAH